MAFVVFLVCLILSLILGVSMLAPLGIGLLAFTLAALRNGASFRELLAAAGESLRDSLIVIRILLLIGCLTGLWRLSGTVAYFVTLGVTALPPRLFVLAAFLLSSAMSYALGTSFGVTATAGVILMSIARAGGVPVPLAAGAVLSGVYVGDRGSAAASSANLVAALTRTDMRQNVRRMLGTSLLPFGLCCVLYAVLSFFFPLEQMDTGLLSLLEQEFTLDWRCLLPAVLMILLPFCGLSVKWSMTVSLAVSAVVAHLVQQRDLLACVRAALLGFRPSDPALSSMLEGGGIVSMAEICAILAVSCTYGGIFRCGKLLDPVDGKLQALRDRIGRFPVMVLLAFGVCALFCNQTIGVIMQDNLSRSLYGDTEEERQAKMLDTEDTVIVIAGLVPWCIACSVPLSMLGAPLLSVPLAFYLWLIPLCRFFRTRHGSGSSDP